MGKRLDRVKQHLRDNKKTYIATTAGVVVGALGTGVYLNTRSSEAPLIKALLVWRPLNSGNHVTITLLERSTPSKPVHLVGTNLYFSSLSEAARETGHALSAISQQVNGHRADVAGDVFELLEPAA